MRIDLQHSRDPLYDIQRRVPLAALQLSHVAVGEPYLMGERFQGYAPLAPDTSYIFAENLGHSHCPKRKEIFTFIQSL
ncbi:MAG: hypothetical protein BGO02_16135 [Brevundimonas sp. 67-6]|nr:MAG: hypothetical protein BGO02_16135 [Brevundimonas sp. 67-6]